MRFIFCRVYIEMREWMGQLNQQLRLPMKSMGSWVATKQLVCHSGYKVLTSPRL